MDAIIAHVRGHLADFKVPQYVALREQPLPRNPGGKVLKAQLREETELGQPRRCAWMSEPMRETVQGPVDVGGRSA